MILPVFGHRSEAVFSSPVFPSREPTLGRQNRVENPAAFLAQNSRKIIGNGYSITVYEKILESVCKKIAILKFFLFG